MLISKKVSNKSRGSLQTQSPELLLAVPKGLGLCALAAVAEVDAVLLSGKHELVCSTKQEELAQIFDQAELLLICVLAVHEL
jgi:hypothetical protein